MNFDRIQNKKLKYEQNKYKISAVTLSSYEKDFELTFTHNSTAIEGNTLTLMETKVVLEDGISIGGKELREIYEVINHKKAYGYVKKCINENKPLDENIVKDLHAILTENIILGGIYRKEEVRISGAGFTPPAGNEMYMQIKNFYKDLKNKENELNPIELAAWTHAEFVRIHPFIDGNGRTSRLIMNYQLLIHGYLPISIAKGNRLDYYNALEQYAVNGDLTHFADFVAVLEEVQLDEYEKLVKKEDNVQGGII
ncbi:MAG: Fic family protein [Clostridia bacterium]